MSLLLVLLCAGSPGAQQDGRMIVLISDLHLGIGHTPDGAWNPYEDFRWPKALAGFLDAANKEGKERVDLVILGDMLELWQRPDETMCAGKSAQTGCTVPELVTLVTLVTRAHETELKALRRFSRQGSNRVFIVPGNHDAALLVPQAWAPLAHALDTASRRVILVESGVWQSDDKMVLAEHGHQIGSDVNAFPSWPVVTSEEDGEELMIRPWGERFVQKLFNAEEQTYPIIDNLSPESAGARYRIADRGALASTKDVAKFIAFNVFETSFEQKRSVLGKPVPGQPEVFERTSAEAAGYKLFNDSLPEHDPLRAMLDSDTADAISLRSELNTVVKSLSDEDLRMLCRNATAYTGANPCSSTLTAAAVALLVPKGLIFKKHLAARQKQYGEFRVFVYGHTHQWEDEWKVAPGNAGDEVSIFNTGAFQRLIDESQFLEKARARNVTPAEALHQLQPEDLPACYGSVFIKVVNGNPEAQLRLWQMEERGTGQFRQPGASNCPGGVPQ
ncbi:metallophosphoesterase [Paraburkholderia graminis]|uniref:metallophosphoesterase n=1 Tax=Paraburkholderia graminis TaxID=60548 RepID=UPI0038B9E6CF